MTATRLHGPLVKAGPDMGRDPAQALADARRALATLSVECRAAQVRITELETESRKKSDTITILHHEADCLHARNTWAAVTGLVIGAMIGGAAVAAAWLCSGWLLPWLRGFWS